MYGCRECNWDACQACLRCLCFLEDLEKLDQYIQLGLLAAQETSSPRQEKGGRRRRRRVKPNDVTPAAQVAQVPDAVGGQTPPEPGNAIPSQASDLEPDDGLVVNGQVVHDNLTCPGRHGLKIFDSPVAYTCIYCDQEFPEDTVVHGCQVCNRNVCETCYNKGSFKYLMSSEHFKAYVERALRKLDEINARVKVGDDDGT